MRKIVKFSFVKERMLSGINKERFLISDPNCAAARRISTILPQVIQQSPASRPPAVVCIGDFNELLRPDNGYVTWRARGLYDPITVGAKERSFPLPKPFIRMILEPSWESKGFI